MQTIENESLTVEVSEHGAELQSIRQKGFGHEYLWQGDAEYWGRRAPVLFPMVGKVWNGEYRMDGKTYPMGQHGFARDCDFEVVEKTGTKVVFSLKSDENTLRLFPRDFALNITYTLEGLRLQVRWEVTNTGRVRLPFQIGAHPAFAYPEWNENDAAHGYLSFDVTGKLVSTPLVPGGYRSATRPAFDVALDEQGRIALTNSTFDCDTIIDTRGKVRSVTLHDKQGHSLLTMRFRMPIIALWSPRSGKAPFVCIEPWCGGCDIEGYTGEYENRDIIHILEPGERFSTAYDIDIAEQ